MSHIEELVPPQFKEPKIRRFGSMVWGICLIAMLFATGGMTGFWYRDYQAGQDRLQVRKDHLDEIKRLTDAYGRELSDVGKETKAAAGAVAEAATVAEEASSTAKRAVTVATDAAAQSKIAVQQANKAVTNVNNIDKLPEPTRLQINKRVEEVNKRVQK